MQPNQAAQPARAFSPGPAPRHRAGRLVILALAAVLALLGAACGSDQDTAGQVAASSTAPEAGLAIGTFPVEVAGDNGPVTLSAAPQRIISLSASATEMLFAIGAGSQVAAVDDQSNFPAEAPKTDLSGFTPNLEAIVGMTPDLVVVSDATEDLLGGLAKAAVPVLVLGAATKLEDTYRQIEKLGVATGQVGGADKVVKDMRSRVAAVQKKIAEQPKRAQPLTYYHELDDTLYTVTSKTFVGEVYALVGLVNIADAADKDGSGYPQLSAEFLIQADPDLIFLADTKCCGQSAQTVAARPGWSGLKAVKTTAVVALDDDVASRWGPRMVEQLETVAEAMAKLPVAAR